MQYRKFGRTGWNVSDIGYGLWGMGGWSGSDDQQSTASLQFAADAGCTFFDSAWGYGEGKSDQLLGQLLASNPAKRLYAASKVPPKNLKWPAPPFPFLRRSLSPRTCLQVCGHHSHQSGYRCDRPAAVPRLAGRLGRRARLSQYRREAEARWSHSRLRTEPESLGASKRCPCDSHRSRRFRAGDLQHLRPGAGR